VYGLPGVGKTSFVGTCPQEDTGIAACDHGAGSGLLPISEKSFDYIEPTNLVDLEKFTKGEVFKDKKIFVLDNLSTMARTIVKDAALAIPMSGMESRAKYGVAEKRDYMVMMEIIRRTLVNLIDCNPTKHILVMAHEKYDRPNENDAPGTESLVGPELSGQLFTAAPSMFDFVLRLRTRSLLRNPADAKSRYAQRYFQTNQEPGIIAKCRATVNKKALLDREEVFDLESGAGGFPVLLNKIIEGYQHG
jgi:hypothetical protein